MTRELRIFHLQFVYFRNNTATVQYPLFLNCDSRIPKSVKNIKSVSLTHEFTMIKFLMFARLA
jgi:hypothetical protein